MHPALAPYYAAALLVLAAGLPKLVRPGATARSLAQAGLPAWTGLVRALGAAELLLGMTVLLVGGVAPALATAVLFLGFSLFVQHALLRGDVGSCGCFGGEDAAPSSRHVVSTAALAAVAGWVAAAGGAPPVAGLVDALGVAPTAALLAAALADAAVLYLVMARFPTVARPGHQPRQEHRSAASRTRAEVRV